jgi:hypothetical protein
VEFRKFSRDDFDIAKSEGTYGPIWVLTEKGQEWTHYVLRSDIKMTDEGIVSEWTKRTPAVHLDIAHGNDPLRSFSGYKGVYDTDSMDVAVDELFNDLARNAKLDFVEQALEHPIMELNQQLEDVEKTLRHFSNGDIEMAMDNVKISYANLMVKYADAMREVNGLG